MSENLKKVYNKESGGYIDLIEIPGFFDDNLKLRTVAEIERDFGLSIIEGIDVEFTPIDIKIILQQAVDDNDYDFFEQRLRGYLIMVAKLRGKIADRLRLAVGTNVKWVLIEEKYNRLINMIQTDNQSMDLVIADEEKLKKKNREGLVSNSKMGKKLLLKLDPLLNQYLLMKAKGYTFQSIIER